MKTIKRKGKQGKCPYCGIVNVACDDIRFEDLLYCKHLVAVILRDDGGFDFSFDANLNA